MALRAKDLAARTGFSDRGNMERVLIFTRTKHGADKVVKLLAGNGIAAAAIHGNKSQPQRVRALAGAVPRPRLPERVTEVIAGLRWRFQRGPIPPGLRSYTRSPWMVANDRLKRHGWVPTVTNEQAYVEGTEAKWWTMVTPKRRQEITLAASALVLAGVAATIVRIGVRARRSRRTA